MSVFRKILMMSMIVAATQVSMGQDESPQVGDPWKDILPAMEKGDAGALAANFSTMVDLGLPEKDDSYSKSQGELIMREFFKKCPAQIFEVVRTGKINEISHFAICNYITAIENYHVFIQLQDENERFLITRIKFEKQAQ